MVGQGVGRERADGPVTACGPAEQHILGHALSTRRHEPVLEAPGGLERGPGDEQVGGLPEPDFVRDPERAVERAQRRLGVGQDPPLHHVGRGQFRQALAQPGRRGEDVRVAEGQRGAAGRCDTTVACRAGPCRGLLNHGDRAGATPGQGGGAVDRTVVHHDHLVLAREILGGQGRQRARKGGRGVAGGHDDAGVHHPRHFTAAAVHCRGCASPSPTRSAGRRYAAGPSGSCPGWAPRWCGAGTR